MKKRITALVLACVSFAAVTTACAAEPVVISGEAAIKYERDKANGDPAVSGVMYSVQLKGKADLGAGWGLYARLGAQYATNPALADYSLGVYGENKKSVVALDQFGLTYKAGNIEYKLGRQDLTVGSTALLYCRDDGNIGKHVFVDGLTASGKLGAADIVAAAVREDNSGTENNKIYAVRAGFNPNNNFGWGVTLGRYDDQVKGNSNHWALDSTYKQGKHSWTAEYAKSNLSTANKAYAATWNYGFDNKVAAYITAFRVETNADMGQQSNFDNDNKGIYYGANYNFNDANSLELVFKDQKVISSGQKNTKFEAVFTRSF